jgi:hypothetical protein
MAAAVQNPLTSTHFKSGFESQPFAAPTTATIDQQYQHHHVVTTLNYFKDNEDGSPPHPTYVAKPETYDRPTQPQTVTVHDIRGSEKLHSLDIDGFQVVQHESKEKDFIDEEQIKDVYYKETEDLLKKV